MTCSNTQATTIYQLIQEELLSESDSDSDALQHTSVVYVSGSVGLTLH
jgi:hypothetical protein